MGWTFRLLLLGVALQAAPGFLEKKHPSVVMGEPRNYGLFLPPDYDTSGKRYPVIYYFHGHSDRYRLERMDEGKDTVPKIAAFVRDHDVIVVTVDGYLKRDYTGFYGGTPWDVRVEGGQYDFGEYFRELVRHVDGTYRTLTERRYRATSGLSMGGFMSAYLSARYPEEIGSASIFNPGPEFYAGEPGRRSLWRPKDHVANHGHTMVRLVRASGDYISQYHEETRAAYASSPVDFEFRQDEYHRHWATSIGETFAFHMRAFGEAKLDAAPAEWSYTSAYRKFSAWGYEVTTGCTGAALVSLEGVGTGGLRVRTRQWAPDGPAAECGDVQVRTGPLYKAGARYRVMDFDVLAGKLATRETVADGAGRLTLVTGGGTRQLSVVGEKNGLVVLPLAERGTLRVRSGEAVRLPVRIYNPAGETVRSAVVKLRSDWPTVKIVRGRAEVGELGAGEMRDLSGDFEVWFTAGDGDYARARVEVDLGGGRVEKLDVFVTPDGLVAPLEAVVLDGREATFGVFRQQGNQGGGSTVALTVREGKGNGNGVLEAGEEGTVWLKYRQGVDPFDKNTWCRAKVHVEGAGVAEIGDIQESKRTEWTGAQSRTSLLRRGAAAGPVPVVLDCESYSYYWTPDVRFGQELLYQPIQVHRHQLYRWVMP